MLTYGNFKLINKLKFFLTSFANFSSDKFNQNIYILLYRGKSMLKMCVFRINVSNFFLFIYLQI